MRFPDAVRTKKVAPEPRSLIGLQYIVTWSSARMPWVKRLVTGEPKLVAYRGRMLQDAMRHTRVTEDEVRAALRNDGYAGFDDVEAIVLETDGVFSVVGKDTTGGRAALAKVRGHARNRARPPARRPSMDDRDHRRTDLSHLTRVGR